MSYGDGVITKERGKYRVRVPIGGGKYRTVASGIETYEEAAQLLNAARLERVELGDGWTLRRLGPSWLAAIADLRSWKQINSTWHSIVLDAPIADTPVDVLDPREAQAWANTLPKKLKKRSVLRAGKRVTIETTKRLSHKSCEHALSYVRDCVRWAIKEGRCKRNPVDGVRVPPDRQRVEEPISYLSVEDVRALLGFDQLTLEQRTVYSVAVCQCPREGELAGMDWERVDWQERGWWIARSWNGPTKTGRVRWQALVDLAYDALRTWWEHSGRPARGIMFPSPRKDDHGKPKRYARGHDWGWADHPDRNVTRLGIWRRVGIRRIRFHDFRDTAATHLLSGSWGEPWPIKVVSEHLGHRSTVVTEARYAHTTREALRKAAAGVRFVQTPAATPATAAATEAVPMLERVRQQRAVMLVESAGAPSGSGGRDRTYGQSVNREKTGEAERGVTSDAAALRQVRAEMAAIVVAGHDIPAELGRRLIALQAARGQRLTGLVARARGEGPDATEALIELLLEGDDLGAAPTLPARERSA